MGLDARTPGGLRTTQAQSSLRIRAVWLFNSAYVIRFSESIIGKLAAGEISMFVASLYSWVDWFEIRFVRHPEDRFSRNEPKL